MIAHSTAAASLIRITHFNFASPVAKPSRAPMVKPAKRRPMAPFLRGRLRAKVAIVTCSEPWTEHAAAKAEAQGIDPKIANVARQLADCGIYPPPMDLGPDRLPRTGAVLMRRCDGCGRVVPPNNVASYRLVRLCDDCRIEPEVDPDHAADQAHVARAPGAHLCTLMKGVVDDDANRRRAREQLTQIGMTEPEIMAMSFTHAGYSTRRVADLGRWSQSYVRKLLKSAANKLRRSGLALPKPRVADQTSRTRNLNPVKLDGMTERLADRSDCEEPCE
jgi:hypothetical protein